MENRTDLLQPNLIETVRENGSDLAEQRTVRHVSVESMDEMIRLFGVFDENLKIIEEETGSRIRAEGDCIKIEGDEASAELAATVADKLLMMLRLPHRLRF